MTSSCSASGGCSCYTKTKGPCNSNDSNNRNIVSSLSSPSTMENNITTSMLLVLLLLVVLLSSFLWVPETIVWKMDHNFPILRFWSPSTRDHHFNTNHTNHHHDHHRSLLMGFDGKEKQYKAICPVDRTIVRFRYDASQKLYVLDSVDDDEDNNNTNFNNTIPNNNSMTGGEGRQLYANYHPPEQLEREKQTQLDLDLDNTIANLHNWTIPVSVIFRQQQKLLYDGNSEIRTVEKYDDSLLRNKKNQSRTKQQRLQQLQSTATSGILNQHHKGQEEQQPLSLNYHNSDYMNHHRSLDIISYPTEEDQRSDGTNDTATSKDDVSSTSIGTNPSLYVNVRACQCEQRQFCLQQFDSCAVYYNVKDIDYYNTSTSLFKIDCYSSSAEEVIVYVRSFWPLAIFWTIAILYMYRCTERGRIANQYVRRKIPCYRQYRYVSTTTTAPTATPTINQGLTHLIPRPTTASIPPNNNNAIQQQQQQESVLQTQQQQQQRDGDDEHHVQQPQQHIELTPIQRRLGPPIIAQQQHHSSATSNDHGTGIENGYNNNDVSNGSGVDNNDNSNTQAINARDGGVVNLNEDSNSVSENMVGPNTTSTDDNNDNSTDNLMATRIPDSSLQNSNVTEPIVVIRRVRMSEEEQAYNDMIHLLRTNPNNAAFFYRQAIVRERQRQRIAHERHYQRLIRLQQQPEQLQQQEQQQRRRLRYMSYQRRRRQQHQLQADNLEQQVTTVETAMQIHNDANWPFSRQRRQIGRRTGHRMNTTGVDQTVAETDYSTNQPTMSDAADHTMTQTQVTTTGGGGNHQGLLAVTENYGRLVLKTKIFHAPATIPSTPANNNRNDITVSNNNSNGIASDENRNVDNDGGNNITNHRILNENEGAVNGPSNPNASLPNNNATWHVPGLSALFPHQQQNEHPNQPQQPCENLSLEAIMDEEMDHLGEHCAICLALLEDGDVVGDIPCGHLLHKACLKDWLKRKNRCPLCRQTGIARFYDPVHHDTVHHDSVLAFPPMNRPVQYPMNGVQLLGNPYMLRRNQHSSSSSSTPTSASPR